MSDALHRMMLQAFLHSLTEEAANKVEQVMADLQQAFPSPQYFEILNSDRFEEFVASFDQFIQAGNSKQTFRFWNSYLDMVEVLLLLLRGKPVAGSQFLVGHWRKNVTEGLG